MRKLCVVKYLTSRIVESLARPLWEMLVMTFVICGFVGVVYGLIAVLAWLLSISISAVFLGLVGILWILATIYLLARALYWLRVEIREAVELCSDPLRKGNK